MRYLLDTDICIYVINAAIEGAVVLCRGERITAEDVQDYVQVAESVVHGSTISSAGGHIETVKDAEKQLIVRALREAEGNRTVAAKRIGMSRRTLHRKLHDYQLENL